MRLMLEQQREQIIYYGLSLLACAKLQNLASELKTQTS